MVSNELLTIAEAAERLGVHPHTLRIWIKEKRIHPTLFPAARRYGKVRHKHYRVAASEVERIKAVRTLGLPITAA